LNPIGVHCEPGDYYRADAEGTRSQCDTESDGSGTFDDGAVAGLEGRLFDGVKAGAERLEQCGLLNVHS
jgi:hypothetical protein